MFIRLAVQIVMKRLCALNGDSLASGHCVREAYFHVDPFGRFEEVFDVLNCVGRNGWPECLDQLDVLLTIAVCIAIKQLLNLLPVVVGYRRRISRHG